jgi:SAM-dependent methyltransferase
MQQVVPKRSFRFGENWQAFSKGIDAETIEEAKRSLCEMLGRQDLAGQRFLDVGSGSGLLSLAAWQLGAKVCSFDVDSQSVSCTEALRRPRDPDDADWLVLQGSVLDRDFLERLGRFDIVYAWGVLHHTSRLWEALENTIDRVAPGGCLFVAIYNDQGRASQRWKRIKWCYNVLPRPLRWPLLGLALLRLWGPTTLRDFLRGTPFRTWRDYRRTSRGMSPWRDTIDWVGGYPFEVAKPEEVIAFCRQRQLEPTRVKTCGRGRGCNEFVLRRSSYLL